MYVVTFYSYKGGVGRTLALLNVAYELADSSQNVLVVDFDLEAPAIYSNRWKKQLSGELSTATDSGDHQGIVEYVGYYLQTMRVPKAEDYITDATPEGCRGNIHLMSSGVLDDSYSTRLNKIDWNDLYLAHDGYVMFEDLRAQWEGIGYDYVLLDSRTGFTDVGGICTRHLPDAVILMFRPEDQSLRGMETIVEAIRNEKPTPRRERPVQLHFAMAAIPDADDEDGILDGHRATFRKKLEIPSERLLEIRHYQSMDLLTQPIYTAVRPRTKLARSFQELTRQIRALNIADRDGVLEYVHKARDGVPDPEQEGYFDRIQRRYDTDPDVLGGLADTHRSRGTFVKAAELWERIAELGNLAPIQLIHLAETRHFTGDLEGTLRALEFFFQDPWKDSSESDRHKYSLVSRGLSLLETLEVDRAAYVEHSPTIVTLPPRVRASVATRLDLSVRERRIAIRILEDVLRTEEGSNRQRNDWEWQLSFARMAVGDCGQAAEYLRRASADAPIVTLVPTAFNLAMAIWGESEAADVAAFADVLAYSDAEDDRSWLENDANKLQALAVAEWFGNRPDDAVQHLADAETALRVSHQRREVSCWSYTRVSTAMFGEHCSEIRRLFAGEDIKPVFMRSSKKASED